MTLLIRWAIMVVALVLSSVLVGLVIPGGVTVNANSPGGILALFMGVALLALANSTVGALAKLLLLPLNCLTLGLVSLVINGLIFWWVGSAGWGFSVNGFFPALLGSVLFSICNALLGTFLPDEEEKGKRRRRD